MTVVDLAQPLDEGPIIQWLAPFANPPGIITLRGFLTEALDVLGVWAETVRTAMMSVIDSLVSKPRDMHGRFG